MELESNFVTERMNQLLKERNWTIYRLAKESDIAYSSLNNAPSSLSGRSCKTIIINSIYSATRVNAVFIFSETLFCVSLLTPYQHIGYFPYHSMLENLKNLI